MWSKSKEAELNVFGLRPEDFAPGEIAGGHVEVLPCNWTSFLVFHAMSTQWTTGAGGPTGLKYEALPEIWRRRKVPPAERDAVFDDLQTLEREALAVIYEKE